MLPVHRIERRRARRREAVAAADAAGDGSSPLPPLLLRPPSRSHQQREDSEHECEPMEVHVSVPGGSSINVPVCEATPSLSALKSQALSSGLAALGITGPDRFDLCFADGDSSEAAVAAAALLATDDDVRRLSDGDHLCAVPSARARAEQTLEEAGIDAAAALDSVRQFPHVGIGLVKRLSGNVAAVRALFVCGVEPTFAIAYSSCRTNPTEVVLAVLEAAPRPVELINTLGDAGRGMLWVAATYGRVDLVEYLLEAGADVTLKDGRGQSVLFGAVAHGGEGACRVVALLLDAGVDVNERNDDGRGALWYAASTATEGQLGVVQLLLERGADAKAVDNLGLRASFSATSEAVSQCLAQYE
eukprot:Rhum_TRINITY_DN14405_c10_g3::Rhum_TRINITY_DN14405_c10_g3_i1::g.88170::m.88170